MIKILSTPLEGLAVIEPRIFRDPRGFFFEAFQEKDFGAAGLPTWFPQDNVSRSSQGTLRGLHFQTHPHAQGKLVSVLEGEVFDVAVDIRKKSPTFGKWFGTTLSAETPRMLYIPPGFAHGFLVTSETAVFHYKCTVVYAPGAERTLRWDDLTVSIQWPEAGGTVSLSDKDRAGRTWPELAADF